MKNFVSIFYLNPLLNTAKSIKTSLNIKNKTINIVENEALVKSKIMFNKYLKVSKILKYNKALKYVTVSTICYND